MEKQKRNQVRLNLMVEEKIREKIERLKEIGKYKSMTAVIEDAVNRLELEYEIQEE